MANEKVECDVTGLQPIGLASASPPSVCVVVCLDYMLNSAGVLDVDELRQLIEFARSRKCSVAALLTGHDPETIARSWDRFGVHLAKALEVWICDAPKKRKN